MVARSLLFAAVSVAQGARIKSAEHLNVEVFDAVDVENWVDMNMTAEANPMCDKLWHKELNDYFSDKRVWGSGATACVFGGVDNTGTLVAIKVGKPTESIAGWRAECAEMQLMRMNACKAGDETLALHEEYLPTCTMVAQTKDKKANYYTMHAGGTVAMRDLPKHNLGEELQKNVWAQLVASIYGLIKVDLTHNDLHGQNIVLTEDYKLALIDFGSLKTVARANKDGYKRDSNAIWRWGAVVFGCGEDAEWVPHLPNKQIPVAEQRSRASKFNACLKSKGADASTLKVVKKMTDGCISKSEEQHIEELYKTKFVQKNLKQATKTFFPWSDLEGCRSWDDAKWTTAMQKVEFGSHYKCETTPNWVQTRKKIKDGKTKTRQSEQCKVPEITSACFSTNKKVNAACGGGLNMRLPCENLPIAETGKFFSGGCLKPNHPAYAVAQDYA